MAESGAQFKFTLARFRFKPAMLFILPIISLCFLFYGIRRANAFRQLVNNSQLSSKDLLNMHSVLGDQAYYHLILGRGLLQEGLIEDATHALQQALKLSPDKQIFYELGSIYQQKKEYLTAEKYYDFVRISQPGLLTPKYLLAKLYFESGQNKKWNEMADEVLTSPFKNDSYDAEYMRMEIQQMKEARKINLK